MTRSQTKKHITDLKYLDDEYPKILDGSKTFSVGTKYTSIINNKHTLDKKTNILLCPIFNNCGGVFNENTDIADIGLNATSTADKIEHVDIGDNNPYISDWRVLSQSLRIKPFVTSHSGGWWEAVRVPSRRYLSTPWFQGENGLSFPYEESFEKIWIDDPTYSTGTIDDLHNHIFQSNLEHTYWPWVDAPCISICPPDEGGTGSGDQPGTGEDPPPGGENPPDETEPDDMDTDNNGPVIIIPPLPPPRKQPEHASPDELTPEEKAVKDNYELLDPTETDESVIEPTEMQLNPEQFHPPEGSIADKIIDIVNENRPGIDLKISPSLTAAAKQLATYHDTAKLPSGISHFDDEFTDDTPVFAHWRRAWKYGFKKKMILENVVDLRTALDENYQYIDLVNPNRDPPTAEMAYLIWKNSPEHQENMQNTSVNEIGVSVIGTMAVLYLGFNSPLDPAVYLSYEQGNPVQDPPIVVDPPIVDQYTYVDRMTNNARPNQNTDLVPIINSKNQEDMPLLQSGFTDYSSAQTQPTNPYNLVDTVRPSTFEQINWDDPNIGKSPYYDGHLPDGWFHETNFNTLMNKINREVPLEATGTFPYIPPVRHLQESGKKYNGPNNCGDTARNDDAALAAINFDDPNIVGDPLYTGHLPPCYTKPSFVSRYYSSPYQETHPLPEGPPPYEIPSGYVRIFDCYKYANDYKQYVQPRPGSIPLPDTSNIPAANLIEAEERFHFLTIMDEKYSKYNAPPNWPLEPAAMASEIDPTATTYADLQNPAESLIGQFDFETQPMYDQAHRPIQEPEEKLMYLWWLYSRQPNHDTTQEYAFGFGPNSVTQRWTNTNPLWSVDPTTYPKSPWKDDDPGWKKHFRPPQQLEPYGASIEKQKANMDIDMGTNRSMRLAPRSAATYESENKQFPKILNKQPHMPPDEWFQVTSYHDITAIWNYSSLYWNKWGYATQRAYAAVLLDKLNELRPLELVWPSDFPKVLIQTYLPPSIDPEIEAYTSTIPSNFKDISAYRYFLKILYAKNLRDPTPGPYDELQGKFPNFEQRLTVPNTVLGDFEWTNNPANFNSKVTDMFLPNVTRELTPAYAPPILSSWDPKQIRHYVTVLVTHSNPPVRGTGANNTSKIINDFLDFKYKDIPTRSMHDTAIDTDNQWNLLWESTTDPYTENNWITARAALDFQLWRKDRISNTEDTFYDNGANTPTEFIIPVNERFPIFTDTVQNKLSTWTQRLGNDYQALLYSIQYELRNTVHPWKWPLPPNQDLSILNLSDGNLYALAYQVDPLSIHPLFNWTSQDVWNYLIALKREARFFNTFDDTTQILVNTTKLDVPYNLLTIPDLPKSTTEYKQFCSYYYLKYGELPETQNKYDPYTIQNLSYFGRRSYQWTYYDIPELNNYIKNGSDSNTLFDDYAAEGFSQRQDMVDWVLSGVYSKKGPDYEVCTGADVPGITYPEWHTTYDGILQGINARRTNPANYTWSTYNAPPPVDPIIGYNTALTLAAQRHTEDMIARDYWKGEYGNPHQSSSGDVNGPNPGYGEWHFDRATYFGWGPSDWLVENIYMTTNANHTQEDIVTAWQNSGDPAIVGSHSGNIMGPRMDQIGIGYMEVDRNGTTWYVYTLLLGETSPGGGGEAIEPLFPDIPGQICTDVDQPYTFYPTWYERQNMQLRSANPDADFDIKQKTSDDTNTPAAEGTVYEGYRRIGNKCIDGGNLGDLLYKYMDSILIRIHPINGNLGSQNIKCQYDTKREYTIVTGHSFQKWQTDNTKFFGDEKNRTTYLKNHPYHRRELKHWAYKAATWSPTIP